MTEEKQLNVGLLILRVTLGIVFIAHGYLKVFTFGIRHAMEVFEAHTIWHINMIPGWFAPAAAVIEWTGGITPANPTAAGNTASSSSSAVSLFFWSDLENTQSRTLRTIDSKAIAPNSGQ